MIGRVIDQPVVGKDDPLRPARRRAQRVYVALRPHAPRRVGQQPLVISEAPAADALAGAVFFNAAAAPSSLLGLGLGDVVARQAAEGVYVQRDLVFGVIDSVLVDGCGRCGRLFLRLCGVLSTAVPCVLSVNAALCVCGAAVLCAPPGSRASAPKYSSTTAASSTSRSINFAFFFICFPPVS